MLILNWGWWCWASLDLHAPTITKVVFRYSLHIKYNKKLCVADMFLLVKICFERSNPCVEQSVQNYCPMLADGGGDPDVEC